MGFPRAFLLSPEVYQIFLRAVSDTPNVFARLERTIRAPKDAGMGLIAAACWLPVSATKTFYPTALIDRGTLQT
jgi:hypothetical protein